MQAFTFKPTAFGNEQTWAIRDGRLMRKGGAFALDLAKVRTAHWGELTVRGTRTAWLHLTGCEGTIRLECSDSGDAETRRAFLRCIAAVCETLAMLNPQLEVAQGGGSAARAALFLVGMLGLAVAGLLVWLGLTGRGQGASPIMVISGAALALAMLALAFAHAPWRGRRVLSAQQMSDLIGGWLASLRGP